MRSLAESLGIVDPQKPNEPVTQVSPSAFRMTAKAFATEVLNSLQYRESLLRRIVADKLPPALEQLLYYYRYGKPVEHVELTQQTANLEDMTAEKLEERALRLASLARQIRMNDGSTESPNDGDSEPSSIH